MSTVTEIKDEDFQIVSGYCHRNSFDVANFNYGLRL